MVGNFIGMSDIVAGDITTNAGVASGDNLPSLKNKRIWIMIVKVNEPNNCTIGSYGGTPTDPNNYFSGRTIIDITDVCLFIKMEKLVHQVQFLDIKLQL